MNWSCPVCVKSFPRKDNMQRHMSNRHGTPVFNPNYSAPNPMYIVCQPHRKVSAVSLYAPVYLYGQVAGMTGSGKTVWVKSLLQQAQEVVHLPPERIVWCYSQWQPAYMELMVTVPICQGYSF